MILPLIHIEALADRAWQELGTREGTDRQSYLKGFADGMQVLAKALREASETKPDASR